MYVLHKPILTQNASCDFGADFVILYAMEDPMNQKGDEWPRRNLEAKDIVTFCSWCGKKKEGDIYVEITAEEKAELLKTKSESNSICRNCRDTEFPDFK